MEVAPVAEIPELLIDRPDIDTFETLYKAATPGPWYFKGVFWDQTGPPEFNTVVESDSCGDHTNTELGIDWCMHITSCEEWRTWPDASGETIDGQVVFVVEPVMKLTQVIPDPQGGDDLRIPTGCIKFKRKEDAELVRRSRSMVGSLVQWVRKLELYVSAITRENRDLKEKLAFLEAEFRSQHEAEIDDESDEDEKQTC